MNNLDKKVILVSGGSRGMGAAIAARLVRDGAYVVIGDVRVELGAELAGSLGENCTFVELDVTSEEDWDGAVKVAGQTYGSVNGLVNNAGILYEKDLLSTSLDEWQRTIDVNQRSVFLGMQAVVSSMQAAGGGSIVNTSSTAGMQGFKDCFAYGASKWAVRGMTKAAALELGQYRIRVNSVHPGDTVTDMTAHADTSSGAFTGPETIPLGRHGVPDDVANLVSFLLSDDSSYITGSEHVIDGGFTAGPR